jgi:hypothetical protein
MDAEGGEEVIRRVAANALILIGVWIAATAVGAYLDELTKAHVVPGFMALMVGVGAVLLTAGILLRK